MVSGKIYVNCPFIKILSENSKVHFLEHPSYQNYTHDIIGKKYLKVLNQYICCFCNTSNVKYILARIFEITSVGSLLLIEDTLEFYLNSLGFYDMVNCIMCNIENVDEKIKFILNDNNHSIISMIRTQGINHSRNKFNIHRNVDRFLNNISLNDNKHLVYHDINKTVDEFGKTIIFDIFNKNGTIIAICPLYNKTDFDDLIKNIKINIQGKFSNATNYYVRNSYEPILILFFDLHANNKLTQVSVFYKNLTQTFNLLNSRFSHLKSKNFSVTTLFKDDYNLIKRFYKYYKIQGVDFFYLYYNGISNDEIKEICNKEDILLIDWNFKYWNDETCDFQHHAQIGQMIHALWKYGKTMDKYIGFFDLDEYLTVENKPLAKELLELDLTAYGFCNRWAVSNPNLGEEELPVDFIYGYKCDIPKRSKFIYKTDKISIPYIHQSELPDVRVKQDYDMYHFYNWSQPDRIMPLNYVFVHIGKTGGSSIVDALQCFEIHMKKPKIPPPGTYLFTWVRNPLKRFVSAFNMSHDIINTPAMKEKYDEYTDDNCLYVDSFKDKIDNGFYFTERYDFLINQFRDANHLAESITSENDQERTLANELMNSETEHINKGVGFYFDNGEFIKKNRNCIMYVGRFEHMEHDFREITDHLYLMRELPKKRVNKSNSSKHLSELAVKNLLEFYKDTDYKALQVFHEEGFLDKETLDSYYKFE